MLNPTLGLLLAIGQVPAHLPEGCAAIAAMRRAGITRILLAAGFAAPILLGATVGFFALRDAPEIITLSARALTGAALTARGARRDDRRSHEGETSQLGPISITAGFAIFGAISVYVGS